MLYIVCARYDEMWFLVTTIVSLITLAAGEVLAYVDELRRHEVGKKRDREREISGSVE